MSQGKMASMLVVCASFFTLFLGPSFNYATGVFHVALLEEFQADVTTTAWIGAVFSSMFALMAPVSSVIINMSDCRTCVVLGGITCMTGLVSSFLVTDIRLLFLTFSFIGGLGTALAASGAVVILGYYFPDNAPVASGICIAGAGLGMFVHPALIQYLVRMYDLHGAFLITGGIMLHTSVFGMLMRPSAFERQRQRTVLNGLNYRMKLCASSFLVGPESFCRLVTNVPFIMFVFSVMFFAMGTSTAYLFLPDFFMKEGASFQEASLVISVSGIGSICSRLLSGLASADEQISSLLIYVSIIGITGIFTIFIPCFSHAWYLRIFYGFVLGLYTGGEWVFFNTITLSILGMKHFAAGVGVVMLACGIGFLAGAPLAGTIYKASGRYYDVFLFCVGMFFATSASAFLSAYNVTNKQNQPKANANSANEINIDTSDKLLDLHEEK